MHIHILGICGTFMGSLAVIAKQLGHRVSGSDKNVYPPMSTQLEELGIELREDITPSICSLNRTWSSLATLCLAAIRPSKQFCVRGWCTPQDLSG